MAHGHHDHHTLPADADRRWLSVAFTLIVAFMAGEVVVGLLAQSLALLSDAGHMLTDAGALVLALVAIRLATHPPRGGYTFGLKRAEILAAQANGLTLLLLSAFLAVEAVRRLAHPAHVVGAAVLVTALVGIAVNAAATWAISRANRTSLNVEGAFQHVLTDLFAFVATAVAGLVVLLTGYTRADGIATLVVVALMVRSGIRLLRESGRIFLEAAPAGVEPAAIGGRLAALPGVVEVHDLHVWQVTSGYPAMSAHVLVNESGDCHGLRGTIEVLMRDEYAIEHTTLQVDHVPVTAGGHPVTTDEDPHCADPHGATYRSDSPVDLRILATGRTRVRYDRPVQTLRHWWNGADGEGSDEFVRRDIYYRADGRRWEVEATEGAPASGSMSSRSTRRTYGTEEEALRVLDEWLGDRTGWQEVEP